MLLAHLFRGASPCADPEKGEGLRRTAARCSRSPTVAVTAARRPRRSARVNASGQVMAGEEPSTFNAPSAARHSPDQRKARRSAFARSNARMCIARRTSCEKRAGTAAGYSRSIDFAAGNRPVKRMCRRMVCPRSLERLARRCCRSERPQVSEDRPGRLCGEVVVGIRGGSPLPCAYGVDPAKVHRATPYRRRGSDLCPAPELSKPAPNMEVSWVY
jgi:hypothetical protein